MTKYVVKIEGMMCEHCEKHMCDAFSAAFSPVSAEASHKKGEAVIVSEGDIDEKALADTVAEAGYTFVSAVSEPYEKKGFFSKFRK
jgi:copper chaperone CopZ